MESDGAATLFRTSGVSPFIWRRGDWLFHIRLFTIFTRVRACTHTRRNRLKRLYRSRLFGRRGRAPTARLHGPCPP